MLRDYHTHTPLCRHATGTPEEYVRAACRAGLSEYGIADHAPMCPEPFDDWRMNLSEMPAYLEWIEEARRHAAGTGLIIRCGLECDWLPNVHSWIEKLKGMNDWDYLIGSVHYLGDKLEFDNPFKMDFWEQTSVEDAWDLYWKSFCDMAESGLFTILGHADLIKKFGYRPAGDLRRYYEPALDAVKKSGACLELNTAGWRYKCEEQYPAFEFLRLAAEHDIPLIISSDAHKPDDVGRDFDRALKLAREAGFTSLWDLQAHKTKDESSLCSLLSND